MSFLTLVVAIAIGILVARHFGAIVEIIGAAVVLAVILVLLA